MSRRGFVDAQTRPSRTALAALVARHPGTLLDDKGRTIAGIIAWRRTLEAAVLGGVRASAAQMSHLRAGRNMMSEITPRGSQGPPHQGVHAGAAVLMH